jgi:alpha-mannosidase
MAFFTLKKIQKLAKEINSAVYREVVDIPSFKYTVTECEGAHLPSYDDQNWQDFQVGSLWGGYDVVAWFRARIIIPPEWIYERIYLRFLLGPRDEGESTAEAMLYINGEMLQGLDVWHEEAWIPSERFQAGEISVAIKAWSGVLKVPAQRRFKLAQLIRADRQAEHLKYMTDTLLRTIIVLDENSHQRVEILETLNQTYLIIDFSDPGSEHFYSTIAKAEQFLQTIMMVWESRTESKPKVIGVGHAHIDLAWLWRLKHTREKAARTFTTVLHLMREYPDYCFVQSSPQLYKFIQQDYPHLFMQIKEKIQQGSWEVTGATWVEMDTNIPNGESLVRQFLFGKHFVKQEFDQQMKCLWLPDVFGYSAALPQIIRKSGISYFMTTKISWSQFNRFPNDTFYWRGLDGSEVLTHFVTTPDPGSPFYTYNGRINPEEVQGIWIAYRQKDINNELLLSFGWGDGGGGPTREMLEWATHQKNLPGQPSVELGKAEPFFERLEQRLNEKNLPVWDGELYLEYHRGTYTSQAQIKRANRLAEINYHTAEWAASLTDVLLGGSKYPQDQLNTGWEKILLNQFHDILPGSSIRDVYEDAARDYEQIFSIGNQTIQQSFDKICDQLAVSEDQVVVFNPLAWQRNAVLMTDSRLFLEGKSLQLQNGKLGRCQKISTESGESWLFEVDQIPAMGYRCYSFQENDHPVENELFISEKLLENSFCRIKLNENGQITSIWDKQYQREVLAQGERGNAFQVFEDRPMNFDAWDIDIYYQDKMVEITHLIEVKIEEAGPLRATLRQTWQFRESTITQRLRLYANSPRIDFDTEVDWQHSQVLLKVAFPVDIRSTKATYEIQFGSVERPTHWNTSWDWARFEVNAHKWADLSEGNYGVALLNDCKYGYDIKDNIMRLTLIKSSIDPDPRADQGKHNFTYSLLPHRGDWRQGNVTRQAYELNHPVLTKIVTLAKCQHFLPSEFEFARVNQEHVMLDTLKKAEDDNAWIVRFFEYQQKRCQKVGVEFGKNITSAFEVNLMEENPSPVNFQGNKLTFSITPFEIKTFKIWFER